MGRGWSDFAELIKAVSPNLELIVEQWSIKLFVKLFMSRVIKTIEIEGQPVKALFDTGAFHTYVLRKYLEAVPDRLVPVTKPYEVALGGETIQIRERALVNGKIEGLDFDTSVVPVESLGKANGHDLDAIIGAITLEAWEITVNPKDGSLGLEGLKRREFTEY